MKPVHIPASKAEEEKIAAQWGSLRWMANQPLSSSSVAVARLILTNGQFGELHSHPNADEVIYLFRGKIRVHAGQEVILLEPGDALTIPAKMVHRIENIGSEEAEMTLSYSSGEREYASE